MTQHDFAGLERFISPEPNSGCWLWTGKVNEKGYGKYTLNFQRPRMGCKSYLAHRLVYERIVGTIPVGLELDHLCRIRCCVNPDHLEPVLHRVNVMRGEGVCAKHARQTTCKNGHPLVQGKLQRFCATCMRVYRRRYELKQRTY